MYQRAVRTPAMRVRNYIFIMMLGALHMTFHGCQQTIADIGDAYYNHAGFNDWAESNNIVVVYPQAIKSLMLPSNPEGCFDW